ncbi:hypothetical protein IGL98_000776 [Enterococcus sp. DIV0840]|uniref:DUF1307 domain-containing protein n=1 Tax=Enterococcus TaxID=1350 RepID=UPI001A8D996F|nr:MULTISPECIES: DUF1307 domain-containing protein [Enterococcus]MBO0434039.1 DUF1307 domain-containing protein [Enterococcus sp. DIV0849a]MBO0472945.1 DUF1307 domain-containing protein [Enterococcus ureasiticus]
MKKFCRIVGMSLLFLLFISACGAEKQTATYTLKQDDENVTIQNVYKEDTLLKQTIKTTIQYKTIGVKTKAKAEKLLKPSKELYTDKQGINYSVVFKEKEAVETIEIDLKKLSQDEVNMLPLISLPDGALDSASEKTNAEKLINLGFEKKD